MEYVKNVLTGLFVIALVVLAALVLQALPEIVFAVVFGGGAVLALLIFVLWVLHSLGSMFRGGGSL